MSLPSLNAPSYELVIPSSKKKVKYRPFDFSTKFIRHISRLIRGKYNEFKNTDRYEEMRVLSLILNKILIENRDIKIILFELNGSNGNDARFYQELFKDKSLKDRVILLDSTKILTDNDYFILDDHINKNGHEKLAKEIIEFIE